MKIWLFLPDFREIVANVAKLDENKHPTFYYEDELEIWFYKPIENVLYYTRVSKQEELPKELTISGLKQEFQQAIEIPEQLIRPKTGTITLG